MDPYRQKLIMSYLSLRSAQEDLIDQIINVGMAGVYKDIGDTFTKDDQYVFDVVQFRGTEDFNLNHLLDVYDEMEYSMDLILSENDILDEEVTEVWPEYLELYKPNFIEDELDDSDFDEDFDSEDLDDFDTWS